MKLISFVFLSNLRPRMSLEFSSIEKNPLVFNFLFSEELI